MTTKRLILSSLKAAVPFSLFYVWVAPNDFNNPVWFQVFCGLGIGFAIALAALALYRDHRMIDCNRLT